MSRKARLTLTYLQYDPRSAARVLQNLELAEAAGFLETVPARLTAPVVNSMIPFAAARCLELLAPHRAAAVLRQLTGHDRTSLARLLRGEAREAILRELPEGMSRRILSALRYPVGTVGAWIDPQVPVLRTDNQVKDALKYLQGHSVLSHVFLESEAQGKYCGAVRIIDLVNNRPSARLAELGAVDVQPLSNRASLGSVRFHPAWDDFLMLPVVGRRGTVLGGLSRSALRRGMHEHHVKLEGQEASIAGELIKSLLASCAGVMRLAARSDRPASIIAAEESSSAR